MIDCGSLPLAVYESDPSADRLNASAAPLGQLQNCVNESQTHTPAWQLELSPEPGASIQLPDKQKDERCARVLAGEDLVNVARQDRRPSRE
jgi:hypothetical protein